MPVGIHHADLLQHDVTLQPGQGCGGVAVVQLLLVDQATRGETFGDGMPALRHLLYLGVIGQQFLPGR